MSVWIQMIQGCRMGSSRGMGGLSRGKGQYVYIELHRTVYEIWRRGRNSGLKIL